MSSQLRVELELLSLSLQVSCSVSPDTKEKKARFARKLTKLAKHLRSKEEESKLANLLAKLLQPHEDERSEGKKTRADMQVSSNEK
jgi:DNA primase